MVAITDIPSGRQGSAYYVGMVTETNETHRVWYTLSNNGHVVVPNIDGIPTALYNTICDKHDVERVYDNSGFIIEETASTIEFSNGDVYPTGEQ